MLSMVCHTAELINQLRFVINFLTCFFCVFLKLDSVIVPPFSVYLIISFQPNKNRIEENK